MAGSRISFPAPVINNGDDYSAESVFKCTGSYEIRDSQVNISLNFVLKNPTLEKLYAASKVKYCVTIECQSIFFRETRMLTGHYISFSYPAAKLRNSVSVRPCLVAVEDISGFEPENTHADYSGHKFEIQAGDLMGVVDTLYFPAEKDFSVDKPKMDSILSFTLNKDLDEGPVQIDPSGDKDGKLLVIFPRKTWNYYLELKKDKSTAIVMHSAVVFPVLVEAIKLHRICLSEKWGQRIKEILEFKKLDPEDAFSSAQIILNDPINRSLKALDDLFDANGD